MRCRLSTHQLCKSLQGGLQSLLWEVGGMVELGGVEGE